MKVQYPGVDRAIRSDLDNAELLYGLFSAVSLKGLDVKGLVDELRVRMGDELDYRLEAANQTEFADLYRGHPFIHVPDVVPELSAQRVITSEWVDGLTWAEFEDTADAGGAAARRRGAVPLRAGLDPPPRRLQRRPPPRQLPLPPRRLRHVPRLRSGEAVVAGRVGAAGRRASTPSSSTATRSASSRPWSAAASCPAGHGLDPSRVYDYVSAPYVPYLTDALHASPARSRARPWQASST